MAAVANRPTAPPAGERVPSLPEISDRALLATGGLTSAEAAARLARHGPNELPAERRRGLLTLAAGLAREPMLLLLLGTGAVYLALGDVREAVLLLASVALVAGITLYQEQRTERVLAALRDLSSPRALVLRDGATRRVPGREVVPGDLLVLTEGDRVPADATLRWALSLSVDESLLTGESVPVRKVAVPGSAAARSRGAARPGGDDQPEVYSGTLVVQGEGLAEVRATGPGTELGRIGRTLQPGAPEPTRLQRETGRLVRLFGAAGVALCAVVAVAYGLTRGDWLGGALAGLTLAMGLVPEEFPVVLTVFLALGAWRLARHRVLTRRAAAVESLGAATVLCVDKTGTLTLNRMAVSRLWAPGAGGGDYQNAGVPGPPLPAACVPLLEYGVLAGRLDPVDPMERAIGDLAAQALPRAPIAAALGAPAGPGPGAHPLPGWVLAREYPLSSDLLAVVHVWRPPAAGGRWVVAAKGAPEAVADLCRLLPTERAALLERVAAMAGAGLRVLGVARTTTPPDPGALPDDPRGLRCELLGLIGLADPLRPAVPAALRECHDAGIRVVMATGDYPGTALAIAREAGLDLAGGVLTGPELEGLDEATLRERVRSVNVFARVVPEQKLRLMQALRADGEVVAMTGDGVNDAPALRAADIGIAMGERGTDVAREAADLVLLDDAFASIVRGVRLGRRVFDNLTKAMAFLFAVHVPIAGLALAPVLLGWPLVLLPAHIVFLELLIDPVCSVVFEAEPEEADVMRRRPRRLGAALFGPRLIALGLLQGAGILLAALAVYAGVFALGALGGGADDRHARAVAFATLVVADLGLILVNRSWSASALAALRRPNPALWWVFGATVGLLGAALTVPALRDLFRFRALAAADLALALAAGAAAVAWCEAVKLAARSGRRHR